MMAKEIMLQYDPQAGTVTIAADAVTLVEHIDYLVRNDPQVKAYAAEYVAEHENYTEISVVNILLAQVLARGC